ncbi:haloacid dehalogenase type II [Rhodobacteraceae bacterium]|nr:haloacid dehalogenase type II [Paracoccaceae bacterium]
MDRAFNFDVFGTCVDWRTSVARDVATALPEVDALAFATAWRAEYDPAMARIRSGARGYVPLDILHRENLLRVAESFGVEVPDIDALTAVWERLDPWPDVQTGVQALRTTGLVAPCSNGSIALMARLGRYAGLNWDCIVGAELAQDYKPEPAVYLASAKALGLRPEQVCMVAAHNYDLKAARAVGMQTAFVPRPTEHGPGQTSDLEPSEAWEFIATDFVELAKLVA